MKALVTGFDPFGGDKVNPSSLAVSRLRKKIGKVAVATAVLPTSYARSAGVLREAIDRAKPDIVLCVGQAGGRPELCLERVGINVQDARIPDNDRKQPIDVPVRADGPAAYFSNLPIKACVAEMRKAGLPAVVSNTAGTFVCNHILYALMDIIETHPRRMRGGSCTFPMCRNRRHGWAVPPRWPWTTSRAASRSSSRPVLPGRRISGPPRAASPSSCRRRALHRRRRWQARRRGAAR